MSKTDPVIVVFKPKQPFLDWACTVPKPNNVPLVERWEGGVCTVIMECDPQQELREDLLKAFCDMFTQLLEGWCPRKEFWPKDHGPDTFEKWFDVETVSETDDMIDDNMK